MAEGNCAQDRQMETGTITKAVSSGTLDSAICYKVGNMVNVSGRIHTMNNEQAAGTFFVIPEGFRPRNAVFTSGYINVNNVGNMPILATIQSNGNVSIGYSSSATCSQVGFTGSYAI